MQRRPWPLVILALVQFITPLMSVLFSAYLNHVSVSQMTTVVWNTTGWLERFQFFGAPIVVGFLIWYARTWGFFLVVLYGLFVSWFNLQEWRHAQQPISVALLVIVNFFAIALVVYLCIPRVRAIFFNSRLRWWETKPRYIVNLAGDAKVTSGLGDTAAVPCTIIDLSIGGGGLDSNDDFPVGEKAQVDFQFNQETFTLKGDIVYGRRLPTSYRFGVEWTFDSPQSKMKYKELIAYFKRQRYPETRKPPEWRTDLKSWLERAKKSPTAWVPEVDLKKPVKVTASAGSPKNDGTA